MIIIDVSKGSKYGIAVTLGNLLEGTNGLTVLLGVLNVLLVEQAQGFKNIGNNDIGPFLDNLGFVFGLLEELAVLGKQAFETGI